MRTAPVGARRRRLLILVPLGTAATPAALLGRALAQDGLEPTDLAVLTLVAGTFAWFAAAFVTLIVGFGRVAFGRGDERGLEPGSVGVPAGVRTAIALPICDEDPEAIGIRIRAMQRSLEAERALAAFDLFVLSDSRDAAVVARERAMIASLADDAGARMVVRYRHRRHNHGRKPGNLADFQRQDGAGYPYFVVLDADSVMTGAALVRLVATIHANPRVGIIQTVPRLIGGATPFARLMQFTANLHGPALTRGLTWWFPGEGRYFGHNAIIRTHAFAAALDLPRLSGRPPLGGDLLSHDVVEAVLVRRAGFETWMLPEIEGSYEELPPTLPDYLARARRWGQGDLQHLRLLTMPGISGADRLQLAAGGLGQVAAITLMGLVALAPLAESAPVVDAIWSIGALMLAMLLLPRLTNVGWIALDRDRRRAAGGGWALTSSALAEFALAFVLMPVLMVEHARTVGSTLRGRAVNWTAQRRRAEPVAWAAARRRFGGGAVLALAWLVLCQLRTPELLPLLGPLAAGMLVALPFAVWSSHPTLGAALRARGWWLTPEEVDPPHVLADVAPAPAH